MNTSAHPKTAYDLTQNLRQWFRQSPGRELLGIEHACLERMLTDLFGYYLLQVGCLSFQVEPLRASRIRDQLILTPADTGLAMGRQWIVGDPLRLPVASDSVDVVILPHTLDFSTDPHQVLREVERVLIPEGQVVVIGFNPFSLWGLWRLLRLRADSVPWCGRFLSLQRVRDWLSLLGFELNSSEYLMFRPPLGKPGLMERLLWLERIGGRYWRPLAGVYAVRGKKRVSTLTPVEPLWRLRRRGVIGSRVAEPSTRNGSG